eukprot:11690518-Ditylum_brightwellii.AAC.1
MGLCQMWGLLWYWQLVALKIASEADFGETGVGPQQLIIILVGFSAMTMTFANNPILFSSPCG